MGGRGEISSDSDSEDEEGRERRRLWERQPLRGHGQHAMATNWISAARKRLRFEKTTRGIREGALENTCHSCRGPGNLRCRLANEDGLDGLTKAFEAKYGGADADNLDLWKAFYRRNASHYSVCDACASFKPSTEEVARRMVRGVDVSSSDSDDDDGPRFSGPVRLPSEASGVMMGWLQKARRRLEEEGRVPGLTSNSPADTSVASNGNININDADRTLLISWVEQARNNNRVKAESRGEEISEEIKEVLHRMSASDDWFLGPLREDGKTLNEIGKSLATKKVALTRQCDDDIEAVRSTLSQIEAACAAELESIDANEKQDIKHARNQHDQDMAERTLELTLLLS